MKVSLVLTSIASEPVDGPGRKERFVPSLPDDPFLWVDAVRERGKWLIEGDTILLCIYGQGFDDFFGPQEINL